MKLFLVLLVLLFDKCSAGTSIDAGCISRLRADVTFIVDSSSSVGEDVFRTYVIGFLKDFVNRVTIGDQHVKVAVIVYSSNASVAVGFSSYSSRQQLIRRLDTVPYLSGRTATGEALRLASTVTRSSVKTSIAIVITDGKSNQGFSVAEGARMLARRVNRVIGVGVTDNVNRSELLEIAGGVKEDVYHVDSFEQLRMDVMNMTHWACPPKCSLQIGEKVTLQNKYTQLLASYKLVRMEFTSRLGQLRSQVSESRLSNERLAIGSNNVESKIQSLQSENTLLLSMHKTMSSRVSRLSTEMEELKLKITAESKEKQSLTLKIEEISETLRVETRSVSSVSIETNSLKQMIAKVEAEGTRLRLNKQSYDEQSRTLMVRMRTLQASVEKITREYALEQMNSKKEVAEFDKRVAKLEMELTTMRLDLDKLSLEYQRIQQTYNQLYMDVTKCKSLIAKEHIKSRTLREDIRVLNIKITTLEKKLESANSITLQLKQEMSTKTRSRNDNFDAITLKIKELQIQIQKNTMRAEELRSQRTFSISHLTSVKLEFQKFESEVKRLETSTSTLVRQLEEISETVVIAQNEINSVVIKNEQCNSMLKNRMGALLFAIKSGSGKSVSDVFVDSQYGFSETYNAGNMYFKSIALKTWTTGRFKRISFVLYRQGLPVVLLVFNSREASASDWFTLSNLELSYPWDVVTLKERHLLEQFSFNRDGQFSFIVAESVSSCQIKGFMAISSPNTDCKYGVSGDNSVPLMMYTVDPRGRAAVFDKNALVADELKIYGQYFAFDAVKLSLQPSNPILFSAPGDVDDNIGEIWKGNLCSPPQSYHANVGSTWFKNQAVNYWPVGKYSRIALHIVSASVNAKIVFDARTSNSVTWFSARNLVSSEPWAKSDLAEMHFQLNRHYLGAFWIGSGYGCSATSAMAYLQKNACGTMAAGVYVSNGVVGYDAMEKARHIIIQGYV